MSMVFRRYPEGGNERLLALAIADHAQADGTRVYPSVALLAEMTRQSERSVQRLLHSMLAAGWLQLVRKSSGRRGDTNEYRISPEWLAGGACVPPPQAPDRRTASKPTGDKLAPVQASPTVDKLSTTGDTQGLSGDTQGLWGDTAMSPNPSLPVNTHTPLPPVVTGGCEQDPEAGQPADRQRERGEWRWRDTFDGVCRRGAQLGLPYSVKPLGSAWTDDQLREHQRRYRLLVDAAHDAREIRRGRGGGEAVAQAPPSASPRSDHHHENRSDHVGQQ